MDFFTVQALALNLFYCFFVIAHDWRLILHFNVTRYPTSGAVAATPIEQEQELSSRGKRKNAGDK